MGCDIHLYTEVRRSIGGGKPIWVNCDNWKIDPYEEELHYSINSLYNGRNYRLFAILADVRNEEYQNQSICLPRGLPDDVSDVIRKESDDYGADGHSHSWLTLKEIKDYFAGHPLVNYSGMMKPEEAAKVDAGEMPGEWCKSTTGTGYVCREWVYENRPLKDFIELIDERKRDELWIWSKKDDKPENDAKIRIVFWFDN